MQLFKAKSDPNQLDSNIPTSTAGSGKFRIVFGFMAIVILGAILIPFIADQFSSSGITGDLVDMAYVPTKTGVGNIWLQTDGSFYYTSRVETPSSLSISTESIFNKLYNYRYDPVQKKVLSKVKTDFPNTPPHSKIFYVNNQVWFISPTKDKGEAVIHVFDPDSNQEMFDTTAFLARNPELKSGIATMTIDENPLRLPITTHDGKKFVFEITTNTLFNEQDYSKKSLPNGSDNTVTSVFALSGHDEERQDLYKVSGPNSLIANETFSGLDDTNNFDKKLQITHLTPDQAYLDAEILYQDKDLVIILSQDQIGKTANRLLTAVSQDGKILWTLPQSQLFASMAVTSSDDFSSLFFMKDKFHGERVGDLFIFKMEGAGMVAVDLKTNQLLWKFTAK